MVGLTTKKGFWIDLAAIAVAGAVVLAIYDPALPELEPLPPIPKFEKWPPEYWQPIPRRKPELAYAPGAVKMPRYQSEFMFCFDVTNVRPYFKGCEVDSDAATITVMAAIKDAWTADAVCRSIVASVRRNARVLHDAGYVLRIKTVTSGDKVVSTCPM